MAPRERCELTSRDKGRQITLLDEPLPEGDVWLYVAAAPYADQGDANRHYGLSR